MNKKILFLADANSPHTIRWVKALLDSGYKVGVFCFYKIDVSLYTDFDNMKLYSLNISKDMQSTVEDNFSNPYNFLHSLWKKNILVVASCFA